ncbi:hypothetical protein QQ008_17590 [Fulvivirgaceae bacterium BMA10]|uniref:Uncharacterized protein n=1 Tax=Splendidivirga corallicola TaxID=3051826 RepID=A0ABT8KT89_9BACT|nr:hypothetical protein [Fulvivirgaceae bacterium BMA10]
MFYLATFKKTIKKDISYPGISTETFNKLLDIHPLVFLKENNTDPSQELTLLFYDEISEELFKQGAKI